MLEAQSILEVAVAAPVMGVFDYRAPHTTDGPLQPGQRVRVPFGRGTRLGWLVGSKAASDLPEHRLCRVLSVRDAEPLLPPDLRVVLEQAAREASLAQRRTGPQEETSAAAELVRQGMTINEFDNSPFRQKAEALWATEGHALGVEPWLATIRA